MKLKLLPLWGGLLLFMFAGVSHAGWKTTPSTFQDFSISSAPVCVAVSTGIWTAFPPIGTANLTGRNGVYLLIQSSTTSDMLGLFDKDTSKNVTPASTSLADFRLYKNVVNPPVYIGDTWRIWLKSMNSVADTVCGREFRTE